MDISKIKAKIIFSDGTYEQEISLKNKKAVKLYKKLNKDKNKQSDVPYIRDGQLCVDETLSEE